MTGDERERRDSRALEPELITDPQAKAAAEASNGFRQYDAAIAIIQNALEREPYFEALDTADLAFKTGQVEVSKMEELLASLLANQLAGFYRAVGGKLPE